jgi:uncharacterized membrane protein
MFALLIAMRLVHVLTAIFWVGTALYMTLFLYPAVRDAGPAGGAVMAGVMRRRLPQKMAVVTLLTIVSGFVLYWLAGRGSDGAWYASRPAMVFGAGGIVGTIGYLWATFRVMPTGRALGALGAAIAARGGAPSAEEAQQQVTLMGRMVSGTRTVAWLIAASAALMSVARYLP